jgi:Skp family chaperone for outer membrane proteins
MIVAALFVGSSAAAQSPDQPPVPSARATQVSDDELQTFAKIYTDLQDSKSKHEAALAAAQSEEEAGKIQEDFQKESSATLSEHGWTADKFNSFVRTINADPELAERARALIH